MPSRSHVKSLVKLRRSLTGESPNRLTPMMRAVEQGLSAAERAALVGALCNPGEAALSRDIAERVLPAAVGTAQQDLEGAVFEALLRSMARLESHRTAWTARLGDLVRWVEPRRNRLMLRLNPVVLGPLLCELLPAEAGADGVPELSGIRGLRVQFLLSNHLELYLVDRREQARVVITGVTSEYAHAASAYLAAENPGADRLGTDYADKLAPVESAASRRGVRPHSGLTSALLRRIRVFQDVWWIKATRKGQRGIVVEWPEGPSQRDVLAVLCHPIVGIVHEAEEKTSWPDLGLARLTVPDEILLRSVAGSFTSYARSRRENRVISKAWQAWERACQVVPFEEMVARRREYTGEDQHRAERCLRAGHGRRRRADVLPDANTVAQRYLETSLLLAIRDSAPDVGTGPYTGHQVFAAVSPRPGSLTVDLVDGVAERFFRALLAPVDATDDPLGVPGLRIRPAEDRLHLGLLDSDGRLTDACVTVRGIGARAWTEIWAAIKHTEHDGRCVDPLLDRSPDLSEGELSGMDVQRRHCGPIALGSAMLRRIGLLTSAFALKVWPGGGCCDIQVEIHNGPPIPTVVAALSDPLFGIVDGPVQVSRADESFAEFVDTDPCPARFAGTTRVLMKPPALALRRFGRGDYKARPAVSSIERES